MSSKSPVRSCEDVDETALSYAEIKALCAGNPLIAEKMNLDVEVAKLRMLKAEHQSQRFRLEDDLLKRYPEQITTQTAIIAGIEADTAAYAAEKEKTVEIRQSLTGGAASVEGKFPGMTIGGVEYTEKEPAAKALLESCKTVTDKNEVPVGAYMGFKLNIKLNSLTGDSTSYKLLLRGNLTYQIDLGSDAFGNITRINNALADLPKRLETAKSQLENLFEQQDAAKQELEKPFALADKLAEMETRLALLNAELNIEGNGGMDVVNDEDRREEPGEAVINLSRVPASVPAKSARPSIFDSIREFEAVRPNAVPGNPARKSNAIDL
jgi:hypothetical protein